MSRKITNARVDELESLRNRKSQFIAKIAKEKEGMERILAQMSQEERSNASSSSMKVKQNRGKSTTLTHQDAIEAHQMAIAKLEKDLAIIEKELLEWETILSKG